MIYYYNEKHAHLKQNSLNETSEEEILERIQKDKCNLNTWEQLLMNYTSENPVGENTTYDFVQGSLDLLSCVVEGQDLLKNSFLLHGYYNYHHVLIARVIEGIDQYYVAVPGNDYRREQLVSALFGFEHFISENMGNTGTGAYGYYLMRVKIKEEI